MMRIEFLPFIVLAFAGTALIAFSKQMSKTYNGWTTRFRTKHPNFNPPPTPEMAEKNYKIMVTMFRVNGAILILVSLLLAFWVLNK